MEGNKLIEYIEGHLTFLDDETPSLGYMGVQLQVEILKELRKQGELLEKFGNSLISVDRYDFGYLDKV